MFFSGLSGLLSSLDPKSPTFEKCGIFSEREHVYWYLFTYHCLRQLILYSKPNHTNFIVALVLTWENCYELIEFSTNSIIIIISLKLRDNLKLETFSFFYRMYYTVVCVDYMLFSYTKTGLLIFHFFQFGFINNDIHYRCILIQYFFSSNSKSLILLIEWLNSNF